MPEHLGGQYSNPVEVMGRYSNLSDQGNRIEWVLQSTPSGPKRIVSGTNKQVQRRLLPAQIDDLVAAYQSGATLRELSRQFRVHRASVSIVRDRQSVPRRYRMVEGARLEQVVRDYREGKSIISIANELEVAGDTVRKALTRAGVELRPRPGWQY